MVRVMIQLYTAETMDDARASMGFTWIGMVEPTEASLIGRGATVRDLSPVRSIED